MAIREQKGRKSPFVVYWTNPFTGKRESKSCSTLEDAKKHDAFIKYQLKYERDVFRRTEITEKNSAPTLESELYLYLKARNLEVHNLSRTLCAMRQIVERYGDEELVNIDADRLEKIKGWLTTTGNKWSTIRRKMGIISAMLNWAYRNKHIDVLPLFPEMPQAQYARYVPPTQAEVALMYKAAPDHIKRVIILGYQFGMRVGASEMLKLRWEDVDLISGVIRVPNAKKGLSDHWRDVPIRSDLLPMFRNWLREDAECGVKFVVHYNGHQVGTIKKAWASTLQAAGITRHIRPYDLRHGFATEAIAADVDIGTVANLMGHRSPMMVLKHYQHVRDSQKKAAVEALPAPPICVHDDVYKN